VPIYLRGVGTVIAYNTVLVRSQIQGLITKIAFTEGQSVHAGDLLAQLVGLSTYYFCRAFKQSIGLPPHRYHNNRRIEQAKILLSKPAPSVTEIGLTVGFSETSSFTTAFRKATGLTPTAYHRSFA
jgi:AraC-like DNA-binding protein